MSAGLPKQALLEERALDALQRSERRFRALIENSADGIVLGDAEGRLIYGSPGSRRTLGYGLGETVGLHAVDMVHPMDRAAFEALLAAVKSRPGVTHDMRLRVRHKNGGYRLVEGTLTDLCGDESVGAMVLNYRDITERVESERRRRDAELHMARLKTMYAALSAANEAILRAKSPAELFRNACEIAVRDRRLPARHRVHPRRGDRPAGTRRGERPGGGAARRCAAVARPAAPRRPEPDRTRLPPRRAADLQRLPERPAHPGPPPAEARLHRRRGRGVPAARRRQGDRRVRPAARREGRVLRGAHRAAAAPGRQHLVRAGELRARGALPHGGRLGERGHPGVRPRAPHRRRECRRRAHHPRRPGRADRQGRLHFAVSLRARGRLAARARGPPDDGHRAHRPAAHRPHRRHPAPPTAR